MADDPLKILFASTHGLIDPSSGAALCTRDMLELLAGAGHDCRSITTGVLDYESPASLADVLAAEGHNDPPADARLSDGRGVLIHDVFLNGVRVTMVPTRESRAHLAPEPAEAAAWLDLATQALDRFRPDVLLTYGGHPANLELMRRARQRGVAVVFHLHNLAYDDLRAFEHASTILFPSHATRRHYRDRLGIDGPVIADPLRPERVVAAEPAPRYVTFVNPQPVKGVTVFARIALALHERRPEIPLLVVEGRGNSDWLARLPVDLSGLRNLNRMANTTEPRDFWKVTRVVLMPSLWRETLGRVAMEGLANGVPVLASDRGALPETLDDAGFVFTIPEQFTPENAALPSTRDVAPWVAVIEKLWDDPTFEARHQALARRHAERWKPEATVQAFETLFHSLRSGGKPPPGKEPT